MNNAVKSKRKTDIATTRERINLAILAGRIKSKNNNISLETVKSELVKDGLIFQGESNAFPLTVTDGVYRFRISKSGTVKRVVTPIAAEIAANKEEYYGQVVSNYTAGGKTYRVFYVDEEGYFGEANTIYLKADSDEDELLDFSEISEYTPINTEILEIMNPIWYAQRSGASWTYNEKISAYLCDPTTSDSSSNQAWEEYFDSEKANYAIGSPSIEMYIKSYNQVPHKIGNYTLGVEYGTYKNAYGYKYTLNGTRSSVSMVDYWTGEDTIDYTGYNSMYFGNNGEKKEYFAILFCSPSSLHKEVSCGIWLEHASLNYGVYSQTPGFPAQILAANAQEYGYSPVISLKSGFNLEVEI